MKKVKYFLMTTLVTCALGMVVSCSDEPDTSNYYTFTGEMMNEYLENHSEFAFLLQMRLSRHIIRNVALVLSTN